MIDRRTERDSKRPRVFLDTSVVKHSFREQHALRPRSASIEWQGKTINLTLHDFVTIDPASRVRNTSLMGEIDALSRITALAIEGAIELQWHHEAREEFDRVWTIPSGGQPALLTAPITWVESPFIYSRMSTSLLPGDGWPKIDEQFEFLTELDMPRFLQLQKLTGAYQGLTKNRNQLLDAFHIWCAECAKSTHFLTTDLKLIRHIRRQTNIQPLVSVVSPLELLADIQ